MRARVTAFVLLLVTLPANASAVFRWQSVDKTSCCDATLEITNEAFAAGAIMLRIEHSGPPLPLAASPVIRFEWTG